MTKNYVIQTSPFIVPTTDGKLIEEFFGLKSIDTGNMSFAHMVAPTGWSEPFQTPEFDEITYIINGRKKIEIEDEVLVLETNQSIFIKRGIRVRYSNPFDRQVEYISICNPAFDINKVHREE